MLITANAYIAIIMGNTQIYKLCNFDQSIGKILCGYSENEGGTKMPLASLTELLRKFQGLFHNIHQTF